jgi:mannose-6-phosphate isomerase-like protein (cupin superfamily)
MNLIQQANAPVFNAGDTIAVGYAAPSRGAAEVSLWRVELAPGSTSPSHSMDCEEVFLALEGEMIANVDDVEVRVRAGDCLILPAHTPFTLSVQGAEPFRAVACMPAGGKATMSDGGASFTPPWTE